MMLGMCATLLMFVIVTAGQLSVGQLLARALVRAMGGAVNPEDFSLRSPFFWVSGLIGLFVHMFFVVAVGGALCMTGPGRLFAYQAPRTLWTLFALAPMGVGVWRWRRSGSPFEFRSTSVSINFGLWLAVSMFLGLSLFDSLDGLSTPWTFNFGDLPFHLGMITSFLYSGNLPPEYQIYAGKSLSYPFFVNLWTALICGADQTFSSIDFAFALQWCTLWCGVYFLLAGDRFILLPWSLLLAGGSYEVFAKVLTQTDWNMQGVFGGKFTREQFPWEPLIPTIWVTQRSALLGATTILAAIQFFHQRYSSSGAAVERRTGLVLSGVLLSLGLLGHTHLFIFGALYVGTCAALTAAFRVISAVRLRAGAMPVCAGEMRLLLNFVLSMAPALLALPLIWEKRGTVRFVLGWMPWTVGPEGTLASLIGAIATWSQTWAFVIPVLFLWIGVLRRPVESLALALLFLFGNVVMMSIWDWDQIKYFIGVYIAGLALIASFGSCRGVLLQLSLVPLVIPGGVFFLDFLSKSDNFTIFSSQDVDLAERVRKATEPCAVLIAKAEHNSPVMLTGRRLYSGYGGWTWTHAIDAAGRGTALEGTIDDVLRRVQGDDSFEACAVYLVYTDRERAKWPDLTQAVSSGLLVRTDLPQLFRLLGRSASGTQ